LKLGEERPQVAPVAIDASETLAAKFALMHKAALFYERRRCRLALLHLPNEKTDWEKNHAPDRFCFTQYRNNGLAGHRR
jgi:hypothetical protein